MARAIKTDWHLASCQLDKDTQELVVVELDDQGESRAINVIGLPAILALRDLIDDEIADAEQRGELQTEVIAAGD